MRLLTSLIPADIDMQVKTAASWKRGGFTAFSFNSVEEIAVLQPRFPDIKFIVVPQAPPLISEMVKDVPDNEFVGIVNSDIFLTLTADELSGLKDILVYGHRNDVPNFKTLSGPPFISGFDYFFFYGRHKAVLTDPVFRMGRPAWDYYVPIMVMSKVPAVQVISQVAFHKKHVKRWNTAQHVDYCAHLAKVLGTENRHGIWQRLHATNPMRREALKKWKA